MFSTKFKQLGLKIQYYRQMKNISQVELADEAGISRSYLSKIETGKAQCSVPVLLQIAQVLNVDAGILLTDKDIYSKNQNNFLVCLSAYRFNFEKLANKWFYPDV